MEINNIYGSKPMTELGMLQQELLTARTEILKNRGISKELTRTLGNMKLNAIRDKYPKVKVLHDKYGACAYEWKVQSSMDGIDLLLCYYVKSIPLDGLSKHDKVIAKRYNDAYCYDERVATNYKFKSFKEQCLLGSTYWTFGLNDLTDEKFLVKGLSLSERGYSKFTILLEG